MDFSVIIPVYNRPEQVRQAVLGVLACDFPRERYELIVVDNGSTDSTARVAAEAGARVLSEPIPNRCNARNLGAREARGRWLAFLDSDCVPQPDWLARLAAAVEAASPPDRVGAIAGEVCDAPPSSPVEVYIARRRWIDQAKFLQPGRRFSPPFAATANLAVRRDVYLDVGGLDPGLPYPGEDADVCWRIAGAGWALRYAPDAVVTHYHRSTMGGMIRQMLHWGIGQADLFAKWRGAWGARVWIEPHRWIWAAKALIKTPWSLCVGKTPLDRREAFYDFLSNAAMIVGRVWGGMRHGILVL